MPILSIEGQNATRKSTFAYSAPLPIVGFAFDMGFTRAFKGTAHELFDGLKIQEIDYDDTLKAEELMKRKPWEGNDITIFKLPPPMQMDSHKLIGVRELWNYFLMTLGGVFRDRNVATVVTDTMTIARKVRGDGYLQELQESARAKSPPGPNRERLQMLEWGRPNDSIREIWTTAAGVEKNFIGIHHLREQYMKTYVNGEEKSIPTGEWELDGLNDEDTYKLVDVALRFEKEVKGGTTIVRAAFKKCGYNTDLEAASYTILNPLWDKVMSYIDDTQAGRLELPRADRSLPNGS